MTAATPSRGSRRALVMAAVVVVAGGWILIEAAGVDLPPMSRHWPLFVLVGGAASILDFLAVSRRPGALGLGAFGLALGADLYLLTLDRVPWKRLGIWGPGLYLAVGLGCLAAWSVDRRRSPRLLVLGLVSVGLAITFWGWGEMPLGLFWGALLVVLGAAVAIAVLRRGRS